MLNVVFLLLYVVHLVLCHPNALKDELKANVQRKVKNFDEYPIAPPSLTSNQMEFEDGQERESSEHGNSTPISQSKSQNLKPTKSAKKNDQQRLRRHGRQEFGQQQQNQQSNQPPCHNGQPITLLQPYPLQPCAPQEQQQVSAQQNTGAYPQPPQFYGQQQRQFNPNAGAYNTGSGHQNGHSWIH